MPCSAKFSVTLETEILSTETLDFLKQIIFLKSFNSFLIVAIYFATEDVTVRTKESKKIYRSRWKSLNPNFILP